MTTSVSTEKKAEDTTQKNDEVFIIKAYDLEYQEDDNHDHVIAEPCDITEITEEFIFASKDSAEKAMRKLISIDRNKFLTKTNTAIIDSHTMQMAAYKKKKERYDVLLKAGIEDDFKPTKPQDPKMLTSTDLAMLTGDPVKNESYSTLDLYRRIPYSFGRGVIILHAFEIKGPFRITQ